MPHTLNLLDWLNHDHPIDVVWGHYLFPAGFLAVWFGQLNHCPTIVSARGNDVDRAVFPPGDFARLQWTLAHATQLTAVSQDMAKKVQMVCERNDVITLPNTVDADLFCVAKPDSNKVLRQQLGIADHETVLGFSGELREKKGQRFLLQALTQVLETRPACLLVMGELRTAAQSLLQTFALDHPEAAERVIITGHLPTPEEVVQHLNLCDVYLQPSLWEGMPNALLEAMACERCCIASDAGGIPEVITHGETGFLLMRSQLHQLGHAIIECLALPHEQRQKIGQQARQHVQAKHGLNTEAMMLKTILTAGSRQTLDI
ncbi:GDP-mannose-dependent monoacylated alpha-(1-6)-phosphatidylinositol monomannoside mannosyltransferase [Acaryochloris thomasi RCC1774]|uniref:GDP-mannose-dependent monoacylated alpha-(1-6)-phosphatidylinositol monomannoside mannosyltransferase n=2 Tax=Acaryochloris TaxID=155977 RepID=A0A2W1K6B3_9CYAN|nr:GDP-mannose-dependent monoacylated alpha-(1-6)-phosphatidylinositol monomannoside mannosyltransferase [Acaryochloris thomasi RCC1774]